MKHTLSRSPTGEDVEGALGEVDLGDRLRKDLGAKPQALLPEALADLAALLGVLEGGSQLTLPLLPAML